MLPLTLANTPRSLAAGALAALLFLVPTKLSAFPHIVQKDETLAAIAERYYGRIQLERVLSTANGLDAARGTGIAPGMILEVPALTFHRIAEGDTWKSLAISLLGHEERYITLAQVNGAKPWIEPELGQMIRLPYNLTWTASGEESLATLAYRFLGSTKHAYRIVQYNQLGEDRPEKGRILLIPLSDLKLTDKGEQAAGRAAASIERQSHRAAYETSRNSEQALRQLTSEVRGGRYLRALQNATRLLAVGHLARPIEAEIHRQLLEAAVALDAPGLARSECQKYLDLVEMPNLDPVITSPKVIRACADLKPAGESSVEDTTQP